MSRSKMRDAYDGVQPKNVPLLREDLPSMPAKKPYPNYCKKGKCAHCFELVEVKVYPHHAHPYGYREPCYVTALFHRKAYVCVECGKKKEESLRWALDSPILARELVSYV